MARQRKATQATAERDTLMAQVASETANEQGPIWTQQQADALLAECNKTLGFMAKRGAAVDIDVLNVNALRVRCNAFAACSVLVKKGICTEAELNGEIFNSMLALLRIILQSFEEQQLRQAGGGIEQVRKPKLLVATH